MWGFYLLCVVQSLWLDLSHSKSSSIAPLAISDEFPISGSHLTSFLSTAGGQGKPVSSNAVYDDTFSSPKITDDVSKSRLNGFWNDFFANNILKLAATESMTALFTEIKSSEFREFFADTQNPKSFQDDQHLPQDLKPELFVGELEDGKKCIDLKTEKGSLELCIESPSCQDLSLVDLLSEYIPPTSISVTIDDLSLSCSASWTLAFTAHGKDHKLPHIFEYTGGLGFTMSKFNSHVLLDFMSGASSFSDKIPIPAALKIEDCGVDIRGLEFKVFFTGGTIGKLLDRILAPAIDAVVLHSLDWILCDIFGPLLSRAASRVLVDAVDPLLDSIMSLGIVPEPVKKSGCLSWSTSLVSTVHHLIDAMHVNEASLLKCLVRDRIDLLVEEGENVYTWGKVEDAERQVEDADVLMDPTVTAKFTPVKEHSTLLNILNKLESMLESSVKDVGTVSVDLTDNKLFARSLLGVTLDVLAVSVDGLETLSAMQLLYPSVESNVTLNSSLTFGALNVTLDVRITSVNSDSNDTVSRVVRLEVQLVDVNIDVDLVVAMELSFLDKLYLDQVSHISCLLSALDEFFISSLMLNVDVSKISINIVDMSEKNSSNIGVDVVILVNNLMQLAVEGYPDMTHQLIVGLFQGPIRESLNRKLSTLIDTFHQNYPSLTCEDHINVNSTYDDWIVWPNSTLMQGLNKIVNDFVGPYGMNSLVSCLTHDTNSLIINVPPSAPVFAGWNITIEGLNSFYEFALLSSESQFPYDLVTDFAIGGECAVPLSSTASNLDTNPNCIALNVTIKGYEHNQNFVDVKLSLKNIRLMLDLLLEIDKTTLRNMQFYQLHTQGCFTNAIDIFEIANCSLHTSQVEFYFVEETAEVSLTKLVNNIFGMLLSPTNVASFNAYVDTKLMDARSVCAAGGMSPSSTDTTDPIDQKSNEMNSMMKFFRHSWKWKIYVLIFGTVMSFCFLLRVYYKKGVLLDKSVGDYEILQGSKCDNDGGYHVLGLDISPGVDNGGMALPHSSSPKHGDSNHNNFMSNSWIQFQLQTVIDTVYSFGRELNDVSAVSTSTVPQVSGYDSLIGNETMSLFTRLSVVLFIGVIVFTFAISEVPSSPAALVIMEIDMGNQVSPPITVFKFGLAETVREMWRAEVYYLAILIAFFTGGWPYIKMVAMLLAWLLPSSVLSVEWRNSILVWLDLLGKWSLVDSFVMLVMMVGFNFCFDIVPGVEIRVTVNPQWGFYAFLLATAASLAVGHYVLACHRLCCAVAVKLEEEKLILKSLHGNCLDDNGVYSLKHTESEGFFLESKDINVDSSYQMHGTGDNIVHLHSHWNNQDIAKCFEEGEVETESLMDHVFSVHIVNSPPSSDDLPSSKDGSQDNSCEDEIDLYSPLVVNEQQRQDIHSECSANSTIVHLSDLAEWNFQPILESSYTLSISFTKRGKVCMVVLFGVSTLLVLGGTFIPVIEFDFIGLTGYLMDEPVTSYSLVDIGFKIPTASGDPHSFGVLFIQIIYFAFGIGMPLLFFIFLGGVFVIPFSLPTFRGVVVLAEVLNAWASLDVLVVSAVASVLEIRRFAQFMLGSGCDDMNAILKATMDETLEGNDTCFDVVASMKNTSWMAYAAAFLLLTVGVLMQVLGHKAIAERSLAKKQSAFKPIAVAVAGSDGPALGREGALTRARKRVWFKSMQFLQFVGVVSVKRKITSL